MKPSEPALERVQRFIDVFELARRGGEVGGELPLTAFRRLLPSLAGERGTVRFTFRGRLDERGRPAASLRLAADADLACDRCGQPLTLPFTGEPDFWFVHSEGELARIPVDEGDEEPLLGSAHFDLHELVEDELLLALPMSPRHPDCRSGSVEATAQAAASTPEEPPDRPHPFAALARLKARRS